MKITPQTISTLLVFLTFLLLSCSKQEQKATELVTFPLRGEVVAIDTVKHKLMVAHEEIPNYMDAMTMPFKVKNLELLKSVQIGDSIQGVLAVSRTESWLETFTVTGKGEPPTARMTEETILARMFKEGESLPAIEVTNQGGRKIRFSDFKGKALALTFVYTRCPLPDFCIRMSNHFAKVQRLLARDKSLDGKWHLISISFDPKFDTPKVLKNYGQSYSADFLTWDFVTADQATITKLTDGFGLSFSDDEGGLIAHNLRTVLLDKEGKIMKVISGNEWMPDELVDAMKKAIHEEYE
jgi:protein SCO1/2